MRCQTLVVNKVAGASGNRRSYPAVDVWQRREDCGVERRVARTRLAFGRRHELNLFLEQQIIFESNAEIRGILLAKYHLLTPGLRRPAMELVQHFDMWFEEFEKQRRSQNPSEGGATFVFVGPQGYPSPRKAEEAFVAALDETSSHLGLAPTAVRQP